MLDTVTFVLNYWKFTEKDWSNFKDLKLSVILF